MAKYEALAELLGGVASDRIALSFAEIDAAVGGLPPNAKADRTWWGNTTNRTRVQAHAWMAAGWRVHGVNLGGEEVIFVRQGRSNRQEESHG